MGVFSIVVLLVKLSKLWRIYPKIIITGLHDSKTLTCYQPVHEIVKRCACLCFLLSSIVGCLVDRVGRKVCQKSSRGLSLLADSDFTCCQLKRSGPAGIIWYGLGCSDRSNIAQQRQACKQFHSQLTRETFETIFIASTVGIATSVQGTSLEDIQVCASSVPSTLNSDRLPLWPLDIAVTAPMTNFYPILVHSFRTKCWRRFVHARSSGCSRDSYDVRAPGIEGFD